MKQDDSVPVWLRWMKKLPPLRRAIIARKWRERANKWTDRAEWIMRKDKDEK